MEYRAHECVSYFRDQNPSREADIRSASEEIHRIILNTKAHYYFNNSPSLNTILSQLNPFKTNPIYT